MQNFDIVIVGAGPAGCACALTLKDSGLKVALIDKESFPRDKICGDAIPGKAFTAMNEIDPEWAKAMKEFAKIKSIHSTNFFTPGNTPTTIKWVLYSYNSKRLDFDNFLFQLVRTYTNTSIFEQKRLKQLTPNEKSILCEFEDGTSLNTSLVIGCDGAYSIVRRLLHKAAHNNSYTCSAVRTYAKNIEGIQPGINEVHYFKEYPNAYLWIFPFDDGSANVGFGTLQKTKNQTGSSLNLRETLTQLITTHPTLRNRFINSSVEPSKGFALPLGIGEYPISGNQYMLCGDAASLVDPLGGDGIDNAMWSGLLAARQAIRCFNNSDFSANYIAQYDKEVYKKLGPELRKSTYIMNFFTRFPAIIGVSIWLVQRGQKFSKIFTRKIST